MTRRLAPREHDVLRLLAAGLNYDQMGEALFISTNTVKTMARRLYRSLDACNGPHAVALGYDLGLLQQGSAGTTALGTPVLPVNPALAMASLHEALGTEPA